MSDPTAPNPSPKSPIGDSPLKYQQAYLWLVLVSAMDIMLTWIVLYVGGKEVNPIAEYVIRSTGLAGMLTFCASTAPGFVAVRNSLHAVALSSRAAAVIPSRARRREPESV